MKPYAICHMVTSIDGKILSPRWGKVRGVKSGASLFETTAASFKVPTWIVGTRTMKEFSDKPFRLKKARAAIPREDHVAKGAAQSFAVGADAHGVLRWKRSESDGDHVVLLVSERVGDDYLAHLREAGVSYFFCGKTSVDPATALDKIARHLKVKKVMVQGGGTMNGAFLRAGLIDEISQVVVPVVDGGKGVPPIFDVDPAPAAGLAHLKLTSHRKLAGGVSWFRYKVL